MSYRKRRVTVLARLKSLFVRLSGSALAQNSAWMVGISLVERVMALVQTILIARALGISEYGRYGLLFTTIGFLSSIAGLQMGLMATVFIARFKDNRPFEAAGIRTHVVRYGWIMASIVLVAGAASASPASDWLFRTPAYSATIIVAGALFGVSLLTGIQNGIAQGFENFRGMAIARVIAAVLPVIIIYPVAMRFGLTGACLATLVGGIANYLVIVVMNRRSARQHHLPAKGGGVAFWPLLFGFALPSVSVSFIVGFANWFGQSILSGEVGGMAAVAQANVGLQWRGPILLVATSAATVVLPRMSRHASDGDGKAVRRLRHVMLAINFAASTSIALVLIVLGPLILTVYGKGFEAGWLVFAIIIAGTIPAVVSNVLAQELVGTGRMWTQFAVNIPAALAQILPLRYLVHEYGGTGYAVASLAGSVTLLVGLALVMSWTRASTT